MTDPFLVDITDQPICAQMCHDFLRDKRCGAENLFLGTVREFTGVKRSGILAENIASRNLEHTDSAESSTRIQTVALEYDCYRPFAIAEMKRLLQRAADKWPVQKGLMIHRVGRLELGEVSIAVGISSPHRKASFQACDALVDWAKQSVPVWKREILKDGSHQWIHPDFPKETQLFHGRLDIGNTNEDQVVKVLDKKWKEIGAKGTLRVDFQSEGQDRQIRSWSEGCGLQCRSIGRRAVAVESNH